MQFSGVSLALTWPCRLCLLRFLLCGSLCFKFSPFQALGKVTLPPCCQACMFTFSSCGRWVFPLFCGVFLPPLFSQAFLLLLTGQCCCSCWPPCLFTVYVGSGSSLLSCGVFLPLPLSPASPLLVAGCAPCFCQRLYCPPSLFIYSPGRIPFPQSSALSVPHPLSCMSYLFLLLITQVLFFSLGGGHSVQGAMLLWPRLVCGSTAVPQSSPGLRLPKLSGHRQLVAQGPSWLLHLT
jgi:hypothetical protein